MLSLQEGTGGRGERERNSPADDVARGALIGRSAGGPQRSFPHTTLTCKVYPVITVCVLGSKLVKDSLHAKTSAAVDFSLINPFHSKHDFS